MSEAEGTAARTDPPPKENLVRASGPQDVEVREADGDGGMPTLTGHFAVFDQWTEINSFFEGRFMERFVHGAFKKTFAEGRSRMRALFQHGYDPQVGDKVLGPIEVLEEQERGAYYEVPLLDTSYNRDLVPGLKAGLYGASFRFSVVKEEINNKPEPSDHNPDGLPERTVLEARVAEFGPVTFPAYEGATASVRSMTDEFVVGHLLTRFDECDPARVRAVLEAAARQVAVPEPDPSAGTTQTYVSNTTNTVASNATTVVAPARAAATPEEPEPSAATTPKPRFNDTEEWDRWLTWTTLQG